MDLSWKITRGEQRAGYKKIMPIMLMVLVFTSLVTVVFSYMRSLMYSFVEPISLYLPIIIFVCVPVYFILMRLLPLPSYSYNLSETNIEIRKGNKSVSMPWTEFSGFLDYSKSKSKIFDDTKILGGILYLEKKKVLLGREFYVIRTQPNNTEEVKSLIRNYLPEFEYTRLDDLGLKKIKFS